MNRVSTASWLLSLALLPVACVQTQQQQHEETRVEKKIQLKPPLHLGAVHQVYPEQGFALLRIIGPMPGPGTTLITHPADGSNARVGNLSISSQMPSRDNIVAADIRSGSVMKGDRVFRYRNISESASNNSGDIIAAEPPGGIVADDMTPTSVNEADIPEPNVAGTGYEDAAPLPAEEEESAPANSVETTVLPTTAPAAPDSDPGAPSAPARAPEYLDSIPDDISGWD